MWVLPVPEGSEMARFSARCTHSRVASADWVGTGIEESCSRQESKLFPEGSPAALRRIVRVARSRPRTSSSSRTRSTSAGSQRCAFAVARTSGAAVARTLHRRYTESDTGVDLVFPNHRNGGVMVPDAFHKPWRICRAGTEFEWAIPHTFRKTVATLLDSEIDSVAASKQLGHSSETITKRHYIQRPDQMPDVSDRLERLGPDDERPDDGDAIVTRIA